MDNEQRWVRERDGERERTARSRVAMRRAEDRGKSDPFELRANGAAPSAQSMADALVLVPLSAPACLPLFSPHTLCGPLLFVPCVLCCLLWSVLDDTCTPEPPPPVNACSNPRTSSNMYQLTSRRLCRWYWVQSVRGKCSRVLAVRMAASRPAALIHFSLCGNDCHARASTDSVRIHSRPPSPTGTCVLLAVSSDLRLDCPSRIAAHDEVAREKNQKVS